MDVVDSKRLKLVLWRRQCKEDEKVSQTEETFVEGISDEGLI